MRDSSLYLWYIPHVKIINVLLNPLKLVNPVHLSAGLYDLSLLPLSQLPWGNSEKYQLFAYEGLGSFILGPVNMVVATL